MKLALVSSSVEHTWFIDEDEDHCRLELKGSPDTGFDIDVQVYAEMVILAGEGWHDHFEATGPLEDFVAEMSGRIRDMLSPSMRIREVVSCGVPFRWHLENLIEGNWQTESTNSMLFYPWFGKKTERVFMNSVLPPREHHMDFGQ